MSAPGSRPGKTAPRLIHDCVRFDARYIRGNHNVLTDPPPRAKDDRSPPHEILSVNACRHDFTTVFAQSSLPQLDQRPSTDDHWEIAVICRTCRVHMKVDLNYDQELAQKSCPNSEYPLHHFILQDWPVVLDYHFSCSAPACGAVLRVQYSASAISDHHLDLLTNPDHLAKRFDAATEQEIDRPGFRLATPVDSLFRLWRYVCDALANTGTVKKIPSKNKRFLEAFGIDCSEVFEHLGFEIAVEGDLPVWYLPRCNMASQESQELRALLCVWEVELRILVDNLSTTLKLPNPCAGHPLSSAKEDFTRILSAQGYALRLQFRSSTANSHLSLMYAALGALDDFSDDLVLFCFDRQTMCDPENTPYYLDCLRTIAKSRQSESLQIKSSMIESQGVLGQSDIDEAYQFLDVDPNTSDAFIISHYRSRYEDTGSSVRPRMKAMLQRLAQARQSAEISAVASDLLATYEQALEWLGATAESADDMMPPLFAVKVADGADKANLARKAIDIIAETRDSDMLRAWLKTGEMQDMGMDVETACRHLNIQLDMVDQTMLQVVVDSARNDNPGQKTEQAIAAVTRAYREPQPPPSHPPNTWPVGLTSHGNTCYLNSLLQYYFTIKPLRDLVLDFDQHKFDLSLHANKQERVGARKVKAFEIRAHQKFVKALEGLFRQMITDPGSAVKPDADLVCRAFLAPEDTEIVSTSTASSDVGHSDVEMTNGNAASMPIQQDSCAVEPEAHTSMSSSVTLVGSTQATDETADTVETLKQSTKLPSLQNVEVPQDSAALDLLSRQRSGQELQETNLQKAEEAARQQQDVTEVMDEIMFRLRCAIKPKGMRSTEEQIDPFSDIFYMPIVTFSEVEGVQRDPQTEYAMNILLNIPGEPTDLYTALDEYFDYQIIDHGDVKIGQYKTLQSAPPILQINIPRNTFDRATGRGVKVEHKIHLDDVLYMDRYVDTPGTDIFERRQKCWDRRRNLLSLLAERDVLQKTTLGIDGLDTLELASKYFEDMDSVNASLSEVDHSPIEMEETLLTDMTQDIELVRHRLALIDSSISALRSQIRHEFEGLQSIKYRLHAVFFHRGSYGHGHYWTYIHDFHNNVWRVYNDEKVDEYTKLGDIYDAETWQQGTPTYAVYVRDELKEQYVQPVCRDVSEASNPTREEAAATNTIQIRPAESTADCVQENPDQSQTSDMQADVASE